ncbi:MAG: tRNA pseudouridine(55) synthase TruB [Thermoleophilaceae bacterium]|jgi:tRNA pseudouridine55 synthase|nr:tRNA pseudouridine(55) synthase TruB [Thermoleophilaceae bacterium]
MVPAGVILYPKPAEVTSHDIVARERRRLREAGGGERVKVGHAGTLDPFATGLLLVLVGRATRAQRFLMALPKRYRVVARLGWRSDTGDRDGRLEPTGRVPEHIELPSGEILQRPPAYSAVRVDGERAYRRARRGEVVEPAARAVTVHDSHVLWRDGERAEIELECSAGTYVRQLVADLGDAYCERLERTAIGPFRLGDADAERIVPVAEALAFLPERRLDAAEAERVVHGVSLSDPGELRDGFLRLTHSDRLVAVAEPRDSALKPLVVFAS